MSLLIEIEFILFMPNILDGKKLAQEIELILHQTIESGLKVAKRPPGLAVLRVGMIPPVEFMSITRKKLVIE